MSDELRDRQELEDKLAEVILDTMNKGRFNISKRAAQAIIDDLGLTVEDRNDGSESRTAPDGSIIYGVKCRVVGRWEKQ